MSWLTSMLSDGGGVVSSKRVVTFLAFILCGVGFAADMYGFEVRQGIYDSMMYIVLAGLGFTASEKFAPKKE